VRLSENFTLTEFTKSQTGLRLGIDNDPQGEHLENLRHLVNEIIQPVRSHYGRVMTINSGYRSPELNRAIGGAGTSQHCRGEAADIEIPGVPNYDLALYIQQHCEFDQLILEFYTPGIADSGWVHVSLRRDGKNRKQTLTAMRQKGKTVYRTGLIK
jgi:hypothetical protein